MSWDLTFIKGKDLPNTKDKYIVICATVVQRPVWETERVIFFLSLGTKFNKLFIIFPHGGKNNNDNKRETPYKKPYDNCFLYIVSFHLFQSALYKVQRTLLLLLGIRFAENDVTGKSEMEQNTLPSQGNSRLWDGNSAEIDSFVRGDNNFDISLCLSASTCLLPPLLLFLTNISFLLMVWWLQFSVLIWKLGAGKAVVHGFHSTKHMYIYFLRKYLVIKLITLFSKLGYLIKL